MLRTDVFWEGMSESGGTQQTCIQDGMLGAKRSDRGTITRLCNDADRLKTGLMNPLGLLSPSL
jgi:hypothetical protein